MSAERPSVALAAASARSTSAISASVKVTIRRLVSWRAVAARTPGSPIGVVRSSSSTSLYLAGLSGALQVLGRSGPHQLGAASPRRGTVINFGRRPVSRYRFEAESKTSRPYTRKIRGGVRADPRTHHQSTTQHFGSGRVRDVEGRHRSIPSGGRDRACAASHSPDARVEGVAQAVAHDVQRHHDGERSRGRGRARSRGACER